MTETYEESRARLQKAQRLTEDLIQATEEDARQRIIAYLSDEEYAAARNSWWIVIKHDLGMPRLWLIRKSFGSVYLIQGDEVPRGTDQDFLNFVGYSPRKVCGSACVHPSGYLYTVKNGQLQHATWPNGQRRSLLYTEYVLSQVIGAKFDEAHFAYVANFSSNHNFNWRQELIKRLRNPDQDYQPYPS